MGLDDIMKKKSVRCKNVGNHKFVCEALVGEKITGKGIFQVIPGTSEIEAIEIGGDDASVDRIREFAKKNIRISDIKKVKSLSDADF